MPNGEEEEPGFANGLRDCCLSLADGSPSLGGGRRPLEDCNAIESLVVLVAPLFSRPAPDTLAEAGLPLQGATVVAVAAR